MSAQTPLSCSLSARGISALKALLETLEEQPEADPDTRSLVSSLLTRFKLWVGNLGAHRASGTRSLEYKLRDASMLRNHIVSLLQDLCTSIDEAFAVVLAGDTLGNDNGPDSDRDSLDEELEKLWTDEGQDPDDRSDLDLALSGIRNAVDCLLRLSASIRNPAPHDHFNSRVAADYGAMFELADKNHISEKYTHLDQVVVERLAKSMTRRRQYFKYRQEHASRIADGVEDIGEGVECDYVSEYTANRTTISSLPGHLKDEALVATAAEMADAYDDLDDARSQASETSYAQTDVNSTELRVPRPPPESLHRPFKCPFCHMIITIDNRHQWKKHVFRDLQPYNCLYQSCRLPYQQFSRRSQWMEHMRREHWRVWHCSLGCANATFDSAKQLIEHNKSDHAANPESSSDEDGTMALSSVPDISKARGPCPLCLEVTIANDKVYGKHVGDHLERLALFVLPSVEYGDSSDDDGFQDDSNDDASDGGINNDGQPTTSNNMNEVKPPDSSKTSSQQPRQPDGPLQEPQQIDKKRMDWESYLRRETDLLGDNLDNDMYAESSSQKPSRVRRNRTRDLVHLGPDAPPTYTAAAMEAKKKLEEEERMKKADGEREMFKGLVAAAMGDMDIRRKILEPVGHPGTRQSRLIPLPIPSQDQDHWTGPPSPPTASGSGQGSRSYATIERDRWAVRELSTGASSLSGSDDGDHSPDPPTQVTQDTDAGKKNDEKQPQGLISSFFSKKEKPPQWTDANSEENERSSSGAISSFFTRKKKKNPEPAKRERDLYAKQYGSPPESTGTLSSTHSHDGHSSPPPYGYRSK